MTYKNNRAPEKRQHYYAKTRQHPTMIKNLKKKDLSKRNINSSRKTSNRNEMKDKKFRKSRDVTVILGDSIIKDMKG